MFKPDEPAAKHSAVYDSGGFDDRLYEMRYDAAGAPVLAQQVLPKGGLDHGIWTVLKWIWPQADIPVPPLDWVPNWAPEKQFALGQALAPHAVDMHPTNEHLLPWHLAAGAGGREAAPLRLHASAALAV